MEETRPLRATVAANLKRIRERKHFTQKGLADAVNVLGNVTITRALISQYELMITQPQVDVLDEIATVLGIQAHTLTRPDHRRLDAEAVA